MPDTALTEVDETAVPQTSRKREVAATVTTVAVTIMLGLVANGVIARVGQKVHETIAKPAKPEDEN